MSKVLYISVCPLIFRAAEVDVSVEVVIFEEGTGAVFSSVFSFSGVGAAWRDLKVSEIVRHIAGAEEIALYNKSFSVGALSRVFALFGMDFEAELAGKKTIDTALILAGLLGDNEGRWPIERALEVVDFDAAGTVGGMREALLIREICIIRESRAAA